MDRNKIIERLSEMKKTSGDDEKEYLDELICLVENDCWRSSIVMGWGVFMNSLYQKIEEYGFKSFAEEARNKNLDVGRLEQPNDLNDLKDNDVLIIAGELRILPPQLEDQLRMVHLRRRNNCAHFGSHSPKKPAALDFFAEIFHAIEKLEKKDFETRETEYLLKVKEMPAEEIEELPVDGTQVHNAVKQIKEEIPLIESETDFRSHINYFNYLKRLLKNSTNDKILSECLDAVMVILEVFGSVHDSALRGEKTNNLVSLALKRKEIKKEVASNDNLKRKIITSFANSSSYREAEERMMWLFRIENALSEKDWNIIAQSIAQNRQIYQAHKCRSMLPERLEEHIKGIDKGTLDDLNSKEDPWDTIG